MSVFQDLVEARAQVAAQVDAVLGALERGEHPGRAETEQVECKEEPGRRGRDGSLLPGERQNQAAASYLAREVCCFANTPGGGALILGVEDGTWALLGTELDTSWLRRRIYELADIAPVVGARQVSGARVLVVTVAESPEPVEDGDGKIRWRVDDTCKPVDRSEWWLRRQARAGADLMAAVTGRRSDAVAQGSLVAARRYLSEDGEVDLASVRPDSALLRRLGVLTPNDHLTQAGVLMFAPSARPLVRLARLDVVGGDLLNTYEPSPGLSLLEQISEVEARLDAYNPTSPVTRGLTETPVRALPTRAVREALLNGLAHRDWMQPEPTVLTWVDADARLEVVSPGGFTGGMNADNVLSRRHSRYPALTDLLRALRLVDRQGTGVDRMYREMIVRGHAPPLIREQPGPEVRTALTGGTPDVPVLDLVAAIRPEVRQRDVHIAVLLYELLHAPFLSLQSTAAALQGEREDAQFALLTAGQTTVDGHPLVRPYKDVWLLGRGAVARVERSDRRESLTRRGLLTYRRATGSAAESVVRAWLSAHDRITSGDFAEIAGVAKPTATRTLTALEGHILDRGADVRGRNAHFVAR